jgi:hypothetical protein
LAELIRASSMAEIDQLHRNVSFRDDDNVTRLYAIWTSDTPFIDNIEVDWWFNDRYGGIFRPTADDRQPDTFPGRLVYAYEPNPNGPFRRGTFHDKQWEAWTVTAPAIDVYRAEISVGNPDPRKIIILGCAITRNGVMLATDGPTAKTAHCWFDFE